MSIQDELNQIKNAVYGKDVRDAIHDGVEKGYNKAEQAESNSLDIKQTYDEVLMNWESDPNKDPEVIAARGGLPQLGDRLDATDAQLAHNVYYKSNVFLQRLKNNDITKIKLIGDSITAGVGATGHTIPEDSRIILTTPDGEIRREANHTTNSWANLFRRFIESHNPNIDFFNAGIGGWSTQYAVRYEDLWVDDDEDVLVVMLGTNDRARLLSDYKTDIVNFLNYCNERCNTLIVMCPPPPNSDFDSDGSYASNFGTKEIDEVLYEICKENNYVYISHYKEMLEYCFKANVELNNFMQPAGSHPNDNGYSFIWKTMQSKLNFIDTSLNWMDEWIDFGDVRDPSIKTVLEINDITDVNLDKFSLGVNIWPIASHKWSELGMPSSGLLITYIASKNENLNFNTQTFYSYDGSRSYMRSYSDDGWNQEWQMTEDMFTLRPHNLPDGLLENYKQGVSFSQMTTATAKSVGMPGNAGGLLATIKPSSVDGYAKQIYFIYGSNNIYIRGHSGSSWLGWTAISDVHELSQFPIDEPITSYAPEHVTYSIYSTADESLPEGKRGVLVTYRTKLDSYSYQEYWIYASVTKYRRFRLVSGAWSGWTKITP